MFIVVDKPSCMTERELHGRGGIEDIKRRTSVDAIQSVRLKNLLLPRPRALCERKTGLLRQEYVFFCKNMKEGLCAMHLVIAR